VWKRANLLPARYSLRAPYCTWFKKLVSFSPSPELKASLAHAIAITGDSLYGLGIRRDQSPRSSERAHILPGMTAEAAQSIMQPFDPRSPSRKRSLWRCLPLAPDLVPSKAERPHRERDPGADKPTRVRSVTYIPRRTALFGLP
jgi:hypothetical protein